jgi:Lon protease-like protein
VGMSEKLEELPLFPLQTVLFPYAEQYLHIFEPRYQEMVQVCLKEDRPFGVVLIRTGSESSTAEPYLVGTAVRIVGMHTYDDGRMDIHVRGERRFRIRKLDDSHSFLTGFVEPVVEAEIDEDSETPELLARAKDEVEALIHRMFAHREFDVQVVFPPDPVALSFAIANLLPMENIDKQHLLETTDTLERVNTLLPILENQILEVKPSFFRIGSQELAEWITPN